MRSSFVLKFALAGAAAILAWTPAWAASPACDAKRAEIEASLADAQARGQASQVRGLKRALAANQSHCTDAALAKQREKDISEAQREVAQREKDLQDAQRKGDADKIDKRQAKLDEARAELARAERPLLP
jgi:flagellar motor protein MotB